MKDRSLNADGLRISADNKLNPLWRLPASRRIFPFFVSALLHLVTAAGIVVGWQFLASFDTEVLHAKRPRFFITALAGLRGKVASPVPTSEIAELKRPSGRNAD